MTLPTDFGSFCAGFDLTAARYSGGAGGAFGNLVPGEPAWTTVGTPTFETKSGAGWSLEGVACTGLADQRIIGPLRAFRELTIVAITQPSATGTQWTIGGTNSASNTFGMSHNANRVQANAVATGSGYTAAFTTGRPVVCAVSWDPLTGKMAATAYDGTMRKVSLIATSKRDAIVSWHELSIGGHRTTYLTGWVARALIFARSLHVRDEANLDALILTEAAKVGL